MPTYRVSRKLDGMEMTRYCASAVVETVNGEAFPLSDYEHIEEGDETSDVYRGTWHITKLAFRNRFTPSEKAAIEIAALDNPDAPMQQRALAATLRASQADIQAATYIDLLREDTRNGVLDMETYGLIAPGRAAAILDAPPTGDEVYRGQ